MHVCLSQGVKVSPTMNSHVERKNVNITSPRGHPHPTSPRPQPNRDITSDTPDKGHPTRSLTSPPPDGPVIRKKVIRKKERRYPSKKETLLATMPWMGPFLRKQNIGKKIRKLE